MVENRYDLSFDFLCGELYTGLTSTNTNGSELLDDSEKEGKNHKRYGNIVIIWRKSTWKI